MRILRNLRCLKRMSMFEKLKSLFVIEEEEAPAQKKAAADAQGDVKSQAAQPAAGQEAFSIAKSTGEGGKVRNKFIEVLFGALEKNNKEGFDYLEFKQSLQSLEKMPMDEATRYQSAMAMAKSLGVQRDALIESAKHYISVLTQEELKFKQALKKQQDQKVTQREKELKALQESITARQKQIEQLKKEIEEAGKKAEKIRSSLSVEKQKIQNTANDFMASLKVLTEQIHSDVEKMKQYLK